jgi:hypothetical protein
MFAINTYRVHEINKESGFYIALLISDDNVKHARGAQDVTV